jgi:hypothetical protein
VQVSELGKGDEQGRQFESAVGGGSSQYGEGKITE